MSRSFAVVSNKSRHPNTEMSFSYYWGPNYFQCDIITPDNIVFHILNDQDRVNQVNDTLYIH